PLLLRSMAGGTVGAAALRASAFVLIWANRVPASAKRPDTRERTRLAASGRQRRAGNACTFQQILRHSAASTVQSESVPHGRRRRGMAGDKLPCREEKSPVKQDGGPPRSGARAGQSWTGPWHTCKIEPFGEVAQLVERGTENAKVAGST